MIDVSYGILHYNPDGKTEAYLAFEKAANSLAANATLSREVFIIDQGNREQEAWRSRNLANELGFNFIGLKHNIGISRGINLIASMARGRYVSLVTSDVEFTKNLDVDLVNTLENNRDIWQICPASDKSDIPYQRKGFQASGLIRVFAQELTIQFWPSRVFDTIGYFDERWKACYENLDYAVRMFLAGGYAAISHDTFCPHDIHMSMRSGARDRSYEGYAGMDSGFDQNRLDQIWENKWPRLRQMIDIYSVINADDAAGIRASLLQKHNRSFYLPYIQDVGY